MSVPDRAGKLADVTLGFDELERYEQPHPLFGSIVGRFANRIGQARYQDGERAVLLEANDGAHMLHGGSAGFSTRRWAAATVNDTAAVQLTLVSPDGDGGFPGEVTATVTYTLTDDGQLIVDFAATTTAPTPFNITQHSYWNLSGDAGALIADHLLSVAADAYLPVDAEMIPTGEVRDVAGTAFDLRTPVRLDAQLADAGGFDCNWVLNGTGLRDVASLYHPASGRRLTVRTDQPGLQVYTGQYLGASGHLPYGGLALETQHFPDSPNQPHFPDTMLRPGAPFRSRTVFALSVD